MLTVLLLVVYIFHYFKLHKQNSTMSSHGTFKDKTFHVDGLSYCDLCEAQTAPTAGGVVHALPEERAPRCIKPSESRKQLARFVREHPNPPLSDFTFERRIGSDSLHGVVYEAVHKESQLHVAVKFMPRMKRDTCMEETAIATKLGRKAAEDPRLPFPILVGAGEAVILFQRDSPKADAIGREAVRRNALKEGKSKRESLVAYRDAKESDFPEWVDSMYLISELAVEDVQQSDCPDNYIEDMHCALIALHAEGYVHGDAHLGNFLILTDGSVIIHDFGSSAEIGPYNTEDDDFAFWRNALDKYEKRPP